MLNCELFPFFICLFVELCASAFVLIYFVELWSFPFVLASSIMCDVLKTHREAQKYSPISILVLPVLNIKEYFRVIPFLCKGILGTCGLKIGWIAWPSFFFDTWCLVSSQKGETHNSFWGISPKPILISSSFQCPLFNDNYHCNIFTNYSSS